MFHKKSIKLHFVIFAIIFTGCLVPTYTEKNQGAMEYYAKNQLADALHAIEHNKILKEDYNKILLAMEKSKLLYLTDKAEDAAKLLIEAEYRLEDWNTFFKRGLGGDKEIVSDQRYTKNGEPMPAPNANPYDYNQNKNVRGYVSSTSVPTFKALYKTEYLGTVMEKPMVHYMVGLCGVKLGDDKPLTEAKKLTMLQDQLNIRKSPLTLSVPYTPNPFIDMCTGFFYEQMGDVNDAFIAYERAYKSFKEPNCVLNYGIKTPNQLLPQLIYLSELLGFTDRQDKYLKEAGIMQTQNNKYNTILLLEFNMAPRKYNKLITVTLPDNTETLCNSPFIHAVSNPVSQINVTSKSFSAKADMIYDLNHTMAVVESREIKKEMDNRIREGISSRSENNKTKYTLSTSVSRRNYDTRSWQSLPLQIAYLGANLTEGLNELNVEYMSGNKKVTKKIQITYKKKDKIIPIRIID